MEAIHEYLEIMKVIQENILNYIDEESNVQEKYCKLQNIIDDLQIRDNQHIFKQLLYLLLKVSNNHHRESNFFNKIEQIFILIKKDMTKYFSNSELFHIFKSNKRILLFLLEENIIIVDKYIVKKFFSDKNIDRKYPKYFSPEIKPFANENWFLKMNFLEEINDELPEAFFEKRKIGENDSLICQLIQKDSIDDFIVYINKYMYPIESTITQSIFVHFFETKSDVI